MLAFLTCPQLRKSLLRRGIVSLWLGVVLAAAVCAVPRRLEGEAALVDVLGGLRVNGTVATYLPDDSVWEDTLEVPIPAKAWGYPYPVARRFQTNGFEVPVSIFIGSPAGSISTSNQLVLSLLALPANALLLGSVIFAMLTVVLYLTSKKRTSR